MRSKKQRLEGEYLRLMTCALGERKPPDDLETAIAQFEALVYDSSGADLLNEAKNLNLPPSIRFSDGKTLLGQAVDRFLPVLNNRVISRDRNKASWWVSACSKWQEALQNGTVEDVGGLWVIGECTGHEKWVQCAKAELERRSIEAGPVRQQAAIRVANAMIIQESSNQRKSQSLNHDQTERLLYNMVCFPNFSRPDLLAWGLDLVNRQTSSPSSDLADAIARQPDDWGEDESWHYQGTGCRNFGLLS